MVPSVKAAFAISRDSSNDAISSLEEKPPVTTAR